jgi:murein L,D-transpeptidase YafK
MVSIKKNPISSVLINENRSLAFLIDSLQVKQHNISIQIDKSDYILMVLNKTEILKSYRVVLGSNPKDDKRMEGDRCTPEGTFHIVSKYPHKSWRKFIWIDYPNDESRRKFKEAKLNGEIPKDAKIGGEIGIHGTPEGSDYLIDDKVNWTWGCISLKRKDVDEIYPYINEITEIIIEK